MGDSPTSLLRHGVSDREGATSLGLLDGFELRHDEKLVLLPPSAQRLVAFLALQRRAVQRVYIAGVLWIDSNQDAANASLRTALWRVRLARFRLVEATATHLALSPGIVVDLHDAVAVARRLTRKGATVEDTDLDGLTITGELLPDWYEDWVVLERERFRQMRLHALEALSTELAGEGRYAEAVEAGLAAVAAEPLRESAHRAVIRAHLAEHNRAEALRQYTVFRRLLEEQLGLEPSVEMELLRKQCRAGDGPVTRVGYDMVHEAAQ